MLHFCYTENFILTAFICCSSTESFVIDLTYCCTWQLVKKIIPDRAGPFIQPVKAYPVHVTPCLLRVRAWLQHYVRLCHISLSVVRNCLYRSIRDIIRYSERLFHLRRENVDSRYFSHAFYAITKVKIPVLVLFADVSGFEISLAARLKKYRLC